MILTEEQLINRIINHIVNGKTHNLYIKQLKDGKYSVRLKPSKYTTELHLKQSHSYWFNNYLDYLETQMLQDIEYNDIPEKKAQRLREKQENSKRAFRWWLQDVFCDGIPFHKEYNGSIPI
jgi:hypothetical protein